MSEKKSPSTLLKNRPPRTLPLVFRIMIVGVLLLIGYGLVNIFIRGNTFTGLAITLTGLLIGGASVPVIIKRDFRSSTTFDLYILYGLFLFLTTFGTGKPLVLMWSVILPPIAFYTQGTKRGIFLSFFYCGSLLILTVIALGDFLPVAYRYHEYLETLFVHLILSLMTYVYSYTVHYKEQEITFALYHDSLTGLKNRKQLKLDLLKADKKNLFLINIDDFDEINNLLGSRIGDALLSETAHRLTTLSQTLSHASIYRLHSDEFALLITVYLEETQKEMVVHFIHRSLYPLYQVCDTELSVTASIGTADQGEKLLENADIALKNAKKSRKPVEYFSQENLNRSTYTRNIHLLHRIREAFEKNLVVPHYQPILSVSKEKVDRYESLARIQCEDTLLYPSDFLHLIKRIRLYPELTRRIFRQTLDRFAYRTESFSINLSFEDINDEPTVDYIMQHLSHYNAPERVVFELLETEEILDMERINEFIRRVKLFGARVVLDDFGSGYSNFNYLIELNIDEIKIDGSLIRSITQNSKNRILTETIVAFSKKSGIKTVAEKVEDKKTWEIVKKMGVDYAQGYYIGKPKPAPTSNSSLPVL